MVKRANHLINEGMLIEYMKNSNNKAATWVAHDYADGEPRVEKFSAKFKTPEQVSYF